MNGFDIKPSIEPHDRYQKAFLKLIEAREAVRQLTPDEQERLAFDFLGVRTKEEAIKSMAQFIQGIR